MKTTALVTALALSAALPGLAAACTIKVGILH